MISSRHCFKCVPEILVLCWFQRGSLFLPSFHCLSSQHSRASCSVFMKLCGSELVSKIWVLIWLHCGLRDCCDFLADCSFAFAKEWFTSNYVVNCRVGVMWCWEECMFCGFGVENSVDVYQICLVKVWLLIFCLIDLSNIDSGVLKSPTIIVWASKSLCKSLRTCFMYLGIPVLGVYI